MKLFSVLNGLGWLGAVCAILLIQVIGQLAVDHDWWSPLYPTLLWVGMAMGMLCRGCANSRDREHPSVTGMYLSLITIEAVLSGADPRTRNPAELGLRGLGRVPEADKAHLREVSARVIAEWNRGSCP